MGKLMSIKTDNPCYVFQDCAQSGKYYHYTSFDSFWKILENESMLATQALFSNDSQEIRAGVDIVKTITKLPLNVEDVDNYILCFCKTNDKLSQWRGYCSKGGVSLEFELNNSLEDSTQYYLTKKSNDKTQYCLLETYLYPVIYSSGEDTIDDGRHIVSNESIKKTIETKLEIAKTDFQKSRIIYSSIPLIKNAGFYEEEEFRILFENYIDSGTTKGIIEEYIQHRDRNGAKIPYVAVKFGKDNDDLSNIVNFVYICVTKDYLENGVDTSKISINNINRAHEKEVKELLENIKKVTYNCKIIILRKDEFYLKIGPGCNQQLVYNNIDVEVNLKKFSADKGTIPIYCEGHLPIRSVTISPSANQSEMFDSLSHYFKYGDKYWLKYVKVKKSSIPYREPK